MLSFEASEGQEIFDWARRCKELFQKLQSALVGHGGNGTHYRTVRDYFQRFELWAGFIGVFADSGASLDNRLKFYPEVRDLVLRMLKLLERNLSHDFWFNSASKDDIVQKAPPVVASETSASLAAVAALDAIQEAIDRLRRLAVLIRKSPSSSLASRVQAFARKADSAKVEEFQKMASLFVEGLLPGIGSGLATQLVSSISFRRLRLLYEGKRNEKLKTRRIQVISLPSQLETETIIHEEDPAPVQEDLPQSDVLQPEATPAGPLQRRAYSETEDSGFDFEKFQRFDGSSTDVSDTSTVTSIAQGYFYPPRPKPEKGDQYCACNWCSDEIKVSNLNIPGWWRAHFKKDLQPYVCISEDCSEPAVYFKSFSQWRKHMEDVHTTDWARRIHSPQVWYCDISPHEYLEFGEKGELEHHLKKEHSNDLNCKQLQKRLARNVLLSPRKRNICPLCNQDILKVYELQQHLLSKHETVPPKAQDQKARPSKGSRVRFQDVEDFSSSNEETSKDITDDVPSSLTTEETKKLDLGKVARHIARHLKSLAFLSIRYLDHDAAAGEGDSGKAEPGADDDDSEGSNRADRTTERILDDFPEAAGGKLEFEDIPRAERTDIGEDKHSEVVPLEQQQVYTDRPCEISGRGEVAGTQCHDTTMVDSILDSLSHHTVLREITIVPEIRSALLPHQKEAVDFILKRETEQISSDLSLWKRNDEDADEPFYRHIFSGAKRPEPAEVRGGIIADEMGLGKSLVILSTIAGSIDRSQKFVSIENRQLSCESQKKRASGGTLILAPSSLLIDNWIDEIRKHTNPGSLPFHKHLGPERHKETQLLYERPIVFATYATVATEFRRGDSTLTQINWFRVVLDEAHEIRNRSTKQFQAIASIPALHRWCLTGIPIRNGLDELGALVSFLRVPILDKAPSFRKFIMNPIDSTSNSRFQNLTMLLQTICLRRTRQLLNLPDPMAKVCELTFTQIEKSDYQDLMKKCRRYIDMAVSERGTCNVNAAYLMSLLKLRLFCNNGHRGYDLEPWSEESLRDPDQALIYLEQQGQNFCVYCSGPVYYINDSGTVEGGLLTSSRCHVLCNNCIFLYRVQNQRCPVCSTTEETSPSLPFPLTSTLPVGEYPTKLRTLVSDILSESNQKSIVFSCWKKTLRLACELLRSHAIRYNIIDGSLSLAEWRKVIGEFRSPTGANVLLMTLGTGAVGLNLAIATRVYLLEPQWNPSIESQAIGRALRLGQTSQVVITRYIMADTIEQNNVIFRQKKKLDLAGRGFSRGKDISPERLQAVRDVFGGNADSA